MTDPPARPENEAQLMWEERANRYADGEMSPAEREEFQAELVRDPRAHAAWVAWYTDLGTLGGALTPEEELSSREGFAERVMAAVAREPLPRAQPIPRPPASPSLWARLRLPLAAAAGFGVAALLFGRPGSPPPPREVVKQVVVYRDQPADKAAGAAARPEPLGRLALTNGALELWSPDTARWETATAGTPILPGARLRTSAGRKAAVSLADGTEIRLNEGTTLACAARRDVRLERGQVWSHVTRADSAFRMTTEHGEVSVLSTEIDLAVSPTETRLTVFSGAATLKDRSGRAVTVQAAQIGQIREGKVSNPARAWRLEQTTNWMAELLYLKGRDNPELERKVNGLLASIGEAKLSHLSEQEIRSLGYTCSLPLAKFVAATRDARDRATQTKRRTAARILADIADYATLPDLLELIFDPEEEVRAQAARGFYRLKGEPAGEELAAEIQLWKSGDLKARHERHYRLGEWLREHFKGLQEKKEKKEKN